MKKIALLFSVLFLLFSTSCKQNDAYADKISQLRHDILYAFTEDYEIFAYKEIREEPLKDDGKKDETKNVLTFKIVFKKEMSLKSSPVVQFSIDGINYRKEFEYRPLSNYVSCYFFLPSLPKEKLGISLEFDERKETHTLLTVLNKATINYSEALTGIAESDDEDAKKFFGGNENYEIRIRLIYSDDYRCYYVGLFSASESVSYLVDGENGEIIAKKVNG